MHTGSSGRAERLWGIAAFARNAFDKRYRDFPFCFAPFDQRGVRFATPRIYGIEPITRLWPGYRSTQAKLSARSISPPR